MKFKCGCLVTAWFHWDMNYDGKPSIEIIDIQKYLENDINIKQTSQDAIPLGWHLEA